MSLRTAIAAVIAVLIAALFSRLGVWQVHRLAERRAYNAELKSRLTRAPVPLDRLPPDTALAHYRRVRVTGTFDFAHELVLTARSREEIPGVDIITPLRVPGNPRAVLVNRGWVYSPDAMSIDLPGWRGSADTTVLAYVEDLTPSSLGDPRVPGRAIDWRHMDGHALARAMPYPIEPYYLVTLPNHPRVLRQPIPLALPAFTDEGPHLSYAIQWFSFAAIAIFGAGYVIWLDRRRARATGRPTLITSTGTHG